MHIEFLLPHYKRDSYSLKVTCRNSVDKKFALTINLSLHTHSATEAETDIPFDGFHHVHTQELDDGAIRSFMSNALRNFLYGTWITDEVDFDQFEKILHRNLTPNQQVLIAPILKPQTQKKASILRYFEILSMLFDEGRDIFRNQEQKLTKLAILTKELRELAEETGTQQLFT